MAFPVSDAQLAAFLGSHEMTTRVVVFRGSESLGEIPIIDAEVSATYGTQGGRDASIAVDRDVIDRGLLNPLSDQVIIYVGIKGVIDVPLFTGRCDENAEEDDGLVRVPLESRGVEAQRASFILPWAATTGAQARNEIAKILQEVDPSWGVDVAGARASTIPAGLVWETDRGQALDQLAQGASIIWQPDRTGGFVVYDNPYSVGPILGESVQVFLTDGENGVLTQVRKNTSRQGIWNSVTVITERVNNTTPIRVTALDATVGSPTFWGGPFGKQNLVIKNQTPLDLTQSQDLALRLLRQSLAQQRSFQISMPDMPLLDPGDVFGLWYQDVVYTLVCESVSYSCSATMQTSITARELVLREALLLT